MFAVNFKKVSEKDILVAGGKAASLVKLIKAGFPVPEGFVVLSDAFDEFLKSVGGETQINKWLEELKLKDSKKTTETSDKIRKFILDQPFPRETGKEIIKEFSKMKLKNVAVRSSATMEDSVGASWAGELETYLNTSKKDLLNNIKKCWASLYSPRAISYRLKKGLAREKASVAVAVQEMVQPETAGICFTANPVSGNRSQMIIEGGYGLGEAVVGGKITPDMYTIQKSKLKITDKNISEQKIMIVKNKSGTAEKTVPRSKQGKQKLEDSKIIRLAKMCGEIEKFYGFPQDIEWAFSKNKLYILQSRPITTLN